MSTGSRDFDANSDVLDSGAWGFSSTSVTIAGWVYLDTIPAGRDARFFSKADGTGAANHDWMIGYSESGGAATLRARTHNSSTTLGPAGSLTTGAWHHVAVRAIYNAGVQVERFLYLNGTQAATDSALAVTITSDTNAVYYGNQPTAVTNAPDGRLSDFAVWSVYLDAADIADLAALTTRPSDYPTGLEVYYSGGDITDSSGNGRDASNTGTTLDAADPGFPSGGGATQDLYDGLSKRNRPGRGPYSKGKYLRPSIAAYTSAPVFAAVASDSLSLSDAAVAQTELVASASDSLALSDSSVASVNAVASASDTLTLSDSAEGLVGFTAEAADTLTLSDSALADASKTASASDSLTLSDSSLADVSKVAVASDTLSLTDSALADAIKTVAAADSITLSDSAIASIAAEVAGLFASLSRSNRPGRGPYSLGRYFRTGVDAFTAPPPDLNAVASDSISLNDSALADTIKTATASDSVSLSDSALADASKTAAATDSIALSDSAEGIVGFPAEATDSVTLSDSALADATKAATATDSLTLSDQALADVAKVAEATDTVAFTDSAIGGIDGLPTAVASDTIVFSDSAVVVAQRVPTTPAGGGGKKRVKPWQRSAPTLVVDLPKGDPTFMLMAAAIVLALEDEQESIDG